MTTSDGRPLRAALVCAISDPGGRPVLFVAGQTCWSGQRTVALIIHEASWLARGAKM